jgi:exodeoxyribonuclease VII large subunit
MAESLGAAEALPVLSVTDLNRLLRSSLEDGFPEVWVGGEISNFRVPASGHYYFRLKDEESQLAAVMFRTAQRGIKFRPHDGLEVIVRGRVSLYEVRGDLQLYVDAMEPRGLGAVRLALEQLKRKLEAEGLFDADRKRPLPSWPRTVGVVTALSGAVVHDIVTTLRRRMPAVRILLRPVRVQGSLAGADIVHALEDLGRSPGVDVIIVGRGGGSLEDLWTFNEERVVRAIVSSVVPVVSAVGHEIDHTLADLAADQRASTPTGAAALVVPDVAELARRVDGLAGALTSRMRSQIGWRRERLNGLTRQVRDPRQALRARRVRVDDLGERCRRAMDGIVRLARERCRGGAERLNALSPLAVLQRGFAIVQRVEGPEIIRSAGELAAGDELRVRFAEGGAIVRVKERDA